MCVWVHVGCVCVMVEGGERGGCVCVCDGVGGVNTHARGVHACVCLVQISDLRDDAQ